MRHISVARAALTVAFSVGAAGIASAMPADSAMAKANPGWQRVLLSPLDSASQIFAGGQMVEGAAAAPAADVPAKFASAAIRLSAQAKAAGAKGEYIVAQKVPGQAKMLGIWVNLSELSNVAQVGIQITDSEGEQFVCMTDANWSGWRWVEADVAAGSFVPVGKQEGKNGKIDNPLGTVRVVWVAKAQGPASIVVDELAAVSDLGEKAPAVPLSLSIPSEVTLEAGGKVSALAALTNLSDKETAADVEFLVQQDPGLYQTAAPLPLYGANIATGTRSWIECGGRLNISGALTDGKPWTEAGTGWSNEGWKEAFFCIDLGKSVRVDHMGYLASDGGWMRKVDFAASADGEKYQPVSGLQSVDFHLKWGPQEIDVPQPFEARFIRMRLHNDDKGLQAFHGPYEFYVYAGETPETWNFPKLGATVIQGKLTKTLAPRSYDLAAVGDRQTLPPGSYLVAVRTKAGGVTQMQYGHIFVTPPAMAKVSLASRFGMNGSEPAYADVLRRQGNGWVRFENLRWPFVSPAAGVYSFAGDVAPRNINIDQTLRTYHEAGLSILPYLFHTPEYLVPADPKANHATYPPKDLSKFGEFVFQTVARYGSQKHGADELLTADKLSGLGYLDTVELWENPNLSDPGWGSWKGSLKDYYTMYRFGAEAAKKADPAVKVVNGGWGNIDVALLESMQSFKYPDGKCPLDFTDVLSVQQHSFRVEPELITANDDFFQHPEGLPPGSRSLEQDLDALVSWRDKNKPQMPIWLTKMGYDSGGPRGTDERKQACWLVRETMMALACGVDKVQVDREKGSGDGLFTALGVIRDNSSLKPSYLTYATLIRQLDGVTGRAARVRFDDSNVRAYLWKRADKAILTAWAIRGSARLDARLGRCTVTDAFGGLQALDVQQPLELTEFPIYITDLADAVTVQSLEQQAAKMAAKEQRRIERQSKLAAYLFDFGSKDIVGTYPAGVGVERLCTPVVGADLYDETKGYGFDTPGLKNERAAWYRSPLTQDWVTGPEGYRFTFKAKPGEYALSFFVRARGSGNVTVSGIEGPNQILNVRDETEITKTTVKVGDKPVILQMNFAGGICWVALVQTDSDKD